MIGRAVSFVVALAAAAAAAAVLVVSAAFAIYALLRIYIGPPGSAACVVLFAAIILGLLSAFMFSRVKGGSPRARRGDAADAGVTGRLAALVGDRPFVAAGAAVAAGLLAWRNPTLVSTLLKLADRPPQSRKKR